MRLFVLTDSRGFYSFPNQQHFGSYGRPEVSVVLPDQLQRVLTNPRSVGSSRPSLARGG